MVVSMAVALRMEVVVSMAAGVSTVAADVLAALGVAVGASTVAAAGPSAVRAALSAAIFVAEVCRGRADSVEHLAL